MIMYRVMYEESFISKMIKIRKYDNFNNKSKIDEEIRKFMYNVERTPYMYPSIQNDSIRKAVLIKIKYNIYYVIDDMQKEIYVYEIKGFAENQEEVMSVKIK